MKVKRSIVTTLTFALLFFGAVVLPLSVQITLAQDAPAQTDDTSTNPTTQTNSEQQTENGQRTDTGTQLQFATGAEWIFEGLKAIGTFFAWIGGYLFDISLSWFVLDMKGTAEWLGITTVVTEIWRMIRDIFNLLFIFGIIWVGFRLILGVDESNAKKNLTNIIIAALLINFSLFVAQIVVDFANIVTSEMSQMIKSSATNESSNSTAPKVLDREVTNIADSFIGAMDPTKIMNGSSISALQSTLNNQNELNYTTTEVPEIGIGMALIMGITSAFTLTLVGYVFAAGAFLMFARFLYLMFLMMFSPVMFLGFVLPNFKNKGEQWLHILFGQAFMGPSYLFMLYVALKALEKIKDIQSDSTLISYVMLSLIVCGFVWAALVTAQSMTKTGVAMVDKMAQGAGRSIRGATLGVAGRNTVGRAADNWNRGMEKRGVSERSIFRRAASSVADSKFGGSASRVQIRTADEKASQKRVRNEQVFGSPAFGAPANSVIGSIRTVTTSEQPTEQEKIDMEKKISGLTNEQVMDVLGSQKEGGAVYNKIVEHMTVSQFDAAMKAKDEEFDPKSKDALAKKRAEFVTQSVIADEKAKDAQARAAAVAAGSPPNKAKDDTELMSTGIKTADDHQLKMLGRETLEKHAADLKQSQFDDIMKSKDYSKTEKDALKNKRENQLIERFNKDPSLIFKGLQDKDIASLPKKILLDETGRSVPHITGGALKKMAEDDKLTQEDRGKLLEIITKPGNPPAHHTASKYLDSPAGQEKYG